MAARRDSGKAGVRVDVHGICEVLDTLPQRAPVVPPGKKAAAGVGARGISPFLVIKRFIFGRMT